MASKPNSKGIPEKNSRIDNTYADIFFGAGSRGAFAENLTYTFNLLPVYAAADSEKHNLQNIYQTVQHTNLWVLLTMVSQETFISKFLMRLIRNYITAKQKCLINFRL